MTKLVVEVEGEVVHSREFSKRWEAFNAAKKYLKFWKTYLCEKQYQVYVETEVVLSQKAEPVVLQIREDEKFFYSMNEASRLTGYRHSKIANDNNFKI